MVSFSLVKNIFDTLPIGYYLGRSIECELSKTSDSSYFDPLNDNIVISYIMIKDAAVNIDTTDDIESIVRGLLYHEIAHVILTPAKLKEIDSRYSEEINIVEDERIETICKDLFMNVDFKRNIILINQYEGNDPINADDAFYQLVRYHKGSKYWITRLTQLLYKYKNIKSNTVLFKYQKYVYDIVEFYKEFTKEFNKSKKTENSNSSSNKSKNTNNNSTNKSDETKTDSSKNTSGKSSVSSSDKINNKDKSEDKTAKELSATASNNSDTTDNKDDSEVKISISEKELKHILNSISDISSMIKIDKDKFKITAESIIDIYYDTNLEARLNEIITQKLKKNAINGSAINSYSGRLNVRAVGTRDDYRWWTQQNRAGHVKQYSKVHFTLYIDNSGSFRSNDTNMNIFIRTLSRINNPDFSFDVITINESVVEWPNNNCRFESNGGNKLTNEIGNVIKKHHKPYCNNYDIVLFDGDAHTDDFYKQTPEPFTNFDSNNTIIITDSDNKKYIEHNVYKARVKYVKNYCDEFINSICDLLDRAL